jgi:GNAT superfamily N-acetyltransferase
MKRGEDYQAVRTPILFCFLFLFFILKKPHHSLPPSPAIYSEKTLPLGLRRIVPLTSILLSAHSLFNPSCSFLAHLQFHLRPHPATYDSPTYVQPSKKIHIGELAVEPRFQRLGIGRTMVEWAVARAREEEEERAAGGAAAAAVVTLGAVAERRSLYERAGFRMVGSWCWRKDEKCLLMRWDAEDGIEN